MIHGSVKYYAFVVYAHAGPRCPDVIVGFRKARLIQLSRDTAVPTKNC